MYRGRNVFEATHMNVIENWLTEKIVEIRLYVLISIFIVNEKTILRFIL